MLVNGPKIRAPVLLVGGVKGLIVRYGGVEWTRGTFEGMKSRCSGGRRGMARRLVERRRCL